ncbi:hypothetical protein Zmor_013852 [Zophobas morio]|uniref:Uncharacterized protein n=1 Tax=Zophobas morio TaxID=2755281 RepID=A0AA38IG60_9CUCU|nr:hypothetical protein Zmor_013852 [Zophobas morio]
MCRHTQFEMTEIVSSVQHNLEVCEDSDVTYKKGNTSAWLNGLTIATAEFIGTALLVFLTCMGCTKEMFGEIIPVAQTSLASGLSVMTAIQRVGFVFGGREHGRVEENG